jgi:pyruvate/2-oxoglutarate dehydrogenase complex dihydrolipoamide dehydrogenase (E3) component
MAGSRKQNRDGFRTVTEALYLRDHIIRQLELARTMPRLAGQEIRWMLLDLAPRLLPELDPRLSKTANRVLRRRGVEVLTGESVAEARQPASSPAGTTSLAVISAESVPLDVDKPRA